MPSHGFEIAGRQIGPDHPPYLIAELSGNHGGRLDDALRLIDAATQAGVDAVKIQTYRPDTITIEHGGPGFALDSGPWAGRTLFDLYGQAHTPWEWHEKLFAHAAENGITLFSSPFDPTSVALLESLGAPAYKIASFEIVDIPLIRLVAGTGKPVVISTGLASIEEIGEAFEAGTGPGGTRPALLHCVSGYPSMPEEANLLTLGDLARRFDSIVGLSDHCLTPSVAIAAVALGASIVEKHLTLDRSAGGPDAAFSLQPNEFAELVRGCRDAWLARGAVDYSIKPSEEPNLMLRRSLYVVTDVPRGTVLGSEHVRSIRPGFGLAPKHLDQVIGKKARRDLSRGHPLSWDDLDD